MSWGAIWVYVVAFTSLAAAGFGVPVPEEAGLAAAGVVAAASGGEDGSGPILWWVLLPVCILGVVTADLVLYGLGRRYGDHILKNRWIARLVRPRTRQKIETNFHEYGIAILVVGRLVPGIRAPLFLTAGTIRLRLSRFLIADGIGAVLGNSLFFFLGFWLGNGVVELLKRVESLRPLLVFCVAVAAVTFVILQYFKHPVSTGDPEDVPLIGHKVAEAAHQITGETEAVKEPEGPKPEPAAAGTAADAKAQPAPPADAGTQPAPPANGEAPGPHAHAPGVNGQSAAQANAQEPRPAPANGSGGAAANGHHAAPPAHDPRHRA
jgi:membrane protein DedA with SNARE-associated domain